MLSAEQVQLMQELLALAGRTIQATSPTALMAEQRMERLQTEIKRVFPQDAVTILEKRHYKQRQSP